MHAWAGAIRRRGRLEVEDELTGIAEGGNRCIVGGRRLC